MSLCVCVFVCVCLCVFMCVYVSAPRLLITSGVIWTSYDWLNKFCSFYMAPAVVIGGRGVTLELKRIIETNPIGVN